MTLKEKFDVISCKDCDMPFCDNKCTMLSDWELNKIEQIADEYAIDFIKFFWDLHCKGLYEHLKFKEILEIFKKEKGL